VIVLKTHGINLHTTPESAVQDFFKWQESITDKKYRAEYYKVFEVELEIPFVPTDAGSSLETLK
jgi:hypothetical protein